MTSTIMANLRSLTLPGQTFRPQISESHWRIVYAVDEMFVEYLYDDDDAAVTVRRPISWREWESWIETTRAALYDHPMIYEWEFTGFRDACHIVTVATSPQRARDQVIMRYRQRYGHNPSGLTVKADRVYPISGAVFYPPNPPGKN